MTNINTLYLNFKKNEKQCSVISEIDLFCLSDRFPVASSSLLLLLQSRMGWSFEQLLIQTISNLSYDLDSSELDLNANPKNRIHLK
jgi:hypothetical protein